MPVVPLVCSVNSGPGAAVVGHERAGRPDLGLAEHRPVLEVLDGAPVALAAPVRPVLPVVGHGGGGAVEVAGSARSSVQLCHCSGLQVSRLRISETARSVPPL